MYRHQTSNSRQHLPNNVFHSRSSRHPALWGDGGMGFPALAGRALALALPNQPFGYTKTWGVLFGDIKSPCGNGGTHSLGFKNTVFSYVKAVGLVFGGIKSPGNGHTHSLVLGKYWSRTPASNPVPPGCVVRVPAHWAI